MEGWKRDAYSDVLRSAFITYSRSHSKTGGLLQRSPPGMPFAAFIRLLEDVRLMEPTGPLTLDVAKNEFVGHAVAGASHLTYLGLLKLLNALDARVGEDSLVWSVVVPELERRRFMSKAPNGLTPDTGDVLGLTSADIKAEYTILRGVAAVMDENVNVLDRRRSYSGLIVPMPDPQKQMPENPYPTPSPSRYTMSGAAASGRGSTMRSANNSPVQLFPSLPGNMANTTTLKSKSPAASSNLLDPPKTQPLDVREVRDLESQSSFRRYSVDQSSPPLALAASLDKTRSSSLARRATTADPFPISTSPLPSTRREAWETPVPAPQEPEPRSEPLPPEPGPSSGDPHWAEKVTGYPQTRMQHQAIVEESDQIRVSKPGANIIQLSNDPSSIPQYNRLGSINADNTRTFLVGLSQSPSPSPPPSQPSSLVPVLLSPNSKSHALGMMRRSSQSMRTSRPGQLSPGMSELYSSKSDISENVRGRYSGGASPELVIDAGSESVPASPRRNLQKSYTTRHISGPSDYEFEGEGAFRYSTSDLAQSSLPDLSGANERSSTESLNRGSEPLLSPRGSHLKPGPKSAFTRKTTAQEQLEQPGGLTNVVEGNGWLMELLEQMQARILALETEASERKARDEELWAEAENQRGATEAMLANTILEVMVETDPTRVPWPTFIQSYRDGECHLDRTRGSALSASGGGNAANDKSRMQGDEGNKESHRSRQKWQLDLTNLTRRVEILEREVAKLKETQAWLVSTIIGIEADFNPPAGVAAAATSAAARRAPHVLVASGTELSSSSAVSNGDGTVVRGSSVGVDAATSPGRIESVERLHSSASVSSWLRTGGSMDGSMHDSFRRGSAHTDLASVEALQKVQESLAQMAAELKEAAQAAERRDELVGALDARLVVVEGTIESFGTGTDQVDAVSQSVATLDARLGNLEARTSLSTPRATGDAGADAAASSSGAASSSEIEELRKGILQALEGVHSLQQAAQQQQQQQAVQQGAPIAAAAKPGASIAPSLEAALSSSMRRRLPSSKTLDWHRQNVGVGTSELGPEILSQTVASAHARRSSAVASSPRAVISSDMSAAAELSGHVDAQTQGEPELPVTVVPGGTYNGDELERLAREQVALRQHIRSVDKALRELLAECATWAGLTNTEAVLHQVDIELMDSMTDLDAAVHKQMDMQSKALLLVARKCDSIQRLVNNLLSEPQAMQRVRVMAGNHPTSVVQAPALSRNPSNTEEQARREGMDNFSFAGRTSM